MKRKFMEFQPSQPYKALRCSVYLGDILMTVFQLPNGSYCLSLSEVAAVIARHRGSLLQFLSSKSFKAMMSRDFALLQKLPKVPGELPIEGSAAPITPVSLEIATLYWSHWAAKGNSQAQVLMIALANHSLRELADDAFSVRRTHAERNQQLAEDLSPANIAQLQSFNQQLVQDSFETQTERELKLKIQLAELELGKEQLRHSRNSNCLSAKDMTRAGAMSWLATQWVQQTLGLETEEQAYEQMCRWGYSLDSGRWLRSKLTDDLFVLPWASFDTLTQFVTRLKSEQN